jgi:hypothetical protein
MKKKGAGRAGWHWTKRGWARNGPKRRALAGAKGAGSLNLRRQVVIVAPPEREKPAYSWRAPQIAKERLLQSSATSPAPKSKKHAHRPPRLAWHGKYDQLDSEEKPTP